MAVMSSISKSTRNELAVTDPRWRSRSILHLLNLNFSLVAIILFAATIPMWDRNFFHASGPSRGDWTDGFPIAPLGVAFIFSAVSITSTFVRRQRIPPLASIITYVFILILLLVATVFCGVGSVFPYWQPDATVNQNGVVICNALNMFTRECEPMIYQIGGLQIAGIVFCILVWLNTTLLIVITIQEWRLMKATRRHQLRKLQLYSNDVEQGGRTGKQIRVRPSTKRMSYLPPPPRFSRYSVQHKASTDSVGTTVPFVFIAEPEPSYAGPNRSI